MAHTSEHYLAVLGNIERYYASEKRGRRSSNLLEQLKRKSRHHSPWLVHDKNSNKINKFIVRLTAWSLRATSSMITNNMSPVMTAAATGLSGLLLRQWLEL